MNLQYNKTSLSDYMFQKASTKHIPFSGTFELSPICNFSCQMCYVRKTEKEVKQSSRSILELQQWLDIARDARDAGMLYLLLTGGEPFLWPDFWKLYEQLIHMGLLVSINTNGSLIDEEAVRRLTQLPPKRLNITLYGASDETYEALCGVKNVFSKVDDAITALQKAGVQIKLNCSLTPQNAKDLAKIIAYSKEHKLELQVATYMFPPVRRDAKMIGQNHRFTPQEAAAYRLKTYFLQNGKEMYHEYLKNVSAGNISPPGLDEGCFDPIDGKIRCRAGNASFWITWDGWLTPCGMMNVPKIDLVKSDFGKAWKELTAESKKVTLSGICEACPDRKICHSCAAMAQTETGQSSKVPIYLCEMVREMKLIAQKELS